MRRKTLGKGLGELISGEPIADTRVVIEVPVDRIAPNPFQPRAEVAPDSLEELTLSIETHGVIQPIILRPQGDTYEIIAGERRWRAAQRAGLSTVPCIVQDVDDEHSLQLALIENLQREDLNAVEAARGYRRLVEEFGLTQEKLAQFIGKSRSAIANTLRLLDLPAPVLAAIQAGNVTEGHGRALLGLSGDEEKLLAVWQTVQERGLTVRETEKLVRSIVSPPEVPLAPDAEDEPEADPNLRDAQDRLQNALATKVKIRPKADGKGKIELIYSNPEERERLIELLLLLA